VDIDEPVCLVGEFGEREVTLLDANELGVRMRVPDRLALDRFEIRFGQQLLAARVISPGSAASHECVALYTPRSAAEERAAVVLAYGDSERWLRHWKRREASTNFVASLAGMLAASLKGAHAHARHLGRKGIHG
jgi:cellulose synthase (UDP-forming)